MEIKTIRYTCEDCAFADRCPVEYMCPALECLITLKKALKEDEE